MRIARSQEVVEKALHSLRSNPEEMTHLEEEIARYQKKTTKQKKVFETEQRIGNIV